MSNRMIEMLLLGLTLAFASQQASAQIFGARDRPPQYMEAII
jgi:hypothetical protein